MQYFTADWHLGHENIIEYCQRPFRSVRQMDATIVARYNSIVTDQDEVYFLGDLSMMKDKFWLERIVKRLMGQKHLILGNHDKLDPFEYVEIGFRTVHTALDIGEFILVHDPVAAIVARERKWLCGHVHGLFKSVGRVGNILNVGVDVWNFNPVSIEEIRRWERAGEADVSSGGVGG